MLEFTTISLVVLFTASITTLLVRNQYLKEMNLGNAAYKELYRHAKLLEKENERLKKLKTKFEKS